MANNRVGIEATTTPQFINDLAARGTAAANRATATNLRTAVGGDATGHVRRLGENDPRNAVNAQGTTGTAPQGTGTGTNRPADNGAAAIHLRTGADVAKPNEQRVVAEAATGKQRTDYQNDIDANPSLVNALGVANLHPTADGLVRVEQAINKNAAAWGKVVEAGNAVAATGGKSAAANAALGTAMSEFSKKAGLRTTDTADLTYLLARIMMKSDETERDDSMKRLQAALAAAEARLNKLQEERRTTEQQQTTPVQQQGGGGGKKDDGGNQTSNAAAVADEVARKNTQLAQIDAQMQNQQSLIDDLKSKIAAGGGGAAAGDGSNQDLITEAIIALVEQATAMSALTAAPENRIPEGGGTGTGNGGGTQQNGT